MKSIRIILLFMLITMLNGTQKSGTQDFPLDIVQYPFIRYELNKLHFYQDSSRFSAFFHKLDKLILAGEGQIKILHIGDSHIQADYISGRIRQRLQTFFKGGIASRGLIFPYKAAGTNNPFNYYAYFTGEWEGCRNVERDKYCTLGLSGISATTYDSAATLKFLFRQGDYPHYDFNRIKIFHKIDTAAYKVVIENYEGERTVNINREAGYTEFILHKHLDELVLKFLKTDAKQYYFTIQGILLETDDPGIVYHSAGVNGADIPSFMRCQAFDKHLKVIDPDLIIISLGTNDAYPKKFNRLFFEADCEALLNKIRRSTPERPVILTVPPDSYRYRRYLNKNIPEARKAIIKVAKEYHCAVWDLYTVMGGSNSMILWYSNGLTAADKLHFNKKGYFLQGDLFFNAFVKAYDNYIFNERRNGKKSALK